MNTLGFIALVIIYLERIASIKLALQIFYLSSYIGLGLYIFNPEISQYAGFSGILYGLFVIASVRAITTKDYLLGYPIFLVITIKIIWENIDSTINNASATLINAPVATEAHLYGYLSALLFAVITITTNQLKQRLGKTP